MGERERGFGLALLSGVAQPSTGVASRLLPHASRAEGERSSKGGREAAAIMKLWPEGLAPPALLLHSLQPSSGCSALPAAGTPAQGWGHSGQHPHGGRS